MKTLLLVDDEHAIVEALSGILEDEGYRVVSAPNGREALARLAEAAPALILTDVMMPIMGGRELLAAVRAHPVHARVPVVMMSAVPLSVLQRGASERLPFDAFVQKPFDLGDLLRTVAELAARSPED